MLSGAIFDMDGLMFDSEHLVYKIWQEMLTTDGYSYSPDIFKQTIGLRRNSSEKIYKSIFGQDFDYDGYKEKSHNIFIDRVVREGVPVKKGLYEILEYLKMQDFKIALATSTSSQTAIRLLKMAGVYEYFDALVCGDDVKHGKPHPEVFLTAAKQLGLAPQCCAAFEDSINGIKSAYSAGMTTFMVPDFLQPTSEIMPMIDFLCRDLSQAADFMQKDIHKKCM